MKSITELTTTMTEETMINSVFEKIIIGFIFVFAVYLGLGSDIISTIITGLFLICGLYGAFAIGIAGKPEAIYPLFLGVCGSVILFLKVFIWG